MSDSDTMAVLAESVLGPPGRMISPSKSAYRERWPDHVAIFNANVCADGEKVWFGDIDLSCDGERELIELARSSGALVHLLYEMDARFKHQQTPLLEKAIYSVVPSGHNLFDHEAIERRADGVLYHRRVAGRHVTGAQSATRFGSDGAGPHPADSLHAWVFRQSDVWVDVDGQEHAIASMPTAYAEAVIEFCRERSLRIATLVLLTEIIDNEQLIRVFESAADEAEGGDEAATARAEVWLAGTPLIAALRDRVNCGS